MSNSERPNAPSAAIQGEAPAKRRLAAILAMDAVGYSGLIAEDEEGTIATLRAHRVVIDGIIAAREGRIVGTAGDSVLAEFASPVEAVRCAVEIQDALETRNAALPEPKRLLFRIGLNLGDVMVEGESEDLLGDGVNIAARLEGCADPGGIVVAASVHDQVVDKLPLRFDDMGEQSLKNIPRPVRAFRIAGVAAPSAAAPSSKRVRSRRTLAYIAAAFLVILIGSAYFAGAFRPVGRDEAAPAAAKSTGGDAALWGRVRDSNDPAAIQAYLNAYPHGAFVDLAKARLANLAASPGKTQQSRDKADEGRK